MITALLILGGAVAVWLCVFVACLMSALRDEITALSVQKMSKGQILPPAPPLPRPVKTQRK
jgi:hypothetical protein